MIPNLSITDHAWLRMAQRNLSLTDVTFVVEHGKRYWRAGALHIVLRYKDIPTPEQRAFARLDGTVVLLDDAGAVVTTVYRGNPKSIGKIVRSKTRLDKKQHRAWRQQWAASDDTGMAAGEMA